MRLIAISKLREATLKYPDVTHQIDDFYEIIKKVLWNNLEDVKQTFSSAESVSNFTVINIKGNKYRLILDINYQKKIIFFKYFLTHAEYDKGRWKNDPHY